MMPSTKRLLDVSKETDLKLSVETAKNIFMSRHERETNRAAPVSVGVSQTFQITRLPSALVPRALSSWLLRDGAFLTEIWMWSILYFPSTPKKSWRLTSHETKTRFDFFAANIRTTNIEASAKSYFFKRCRFAHGNINISDMFCLLSLRQTNFILSSSPNCRLF